MLEAHPLDGVTTLGHLRLGKPTVLSESDTLAEVAWVFLVSRTSCAVLDEPPLRVVTERDLADAWAFERSPDDEVGLIASANPCWAPETTSVGDAATLMIDQGIRHLVVVDLAGRPTGVVSMMELFTVLVHDQEPISMYASFAALMTRVERR
jgi:signal-transduction protein with cAMP-binding, CBS, and nucleotidyltransferase domain